VDALRQILLKGNGFARVWPDLLAMLIFAVVIVALATKRFTRRIA
jgi:ABC-2 type transport system permease protein